MLSELMVMEIITLASCDTCTSEERRFGPMNPDTLFVNSLDPKCSVLESEGYIVVAESWGAHLMFHETSDLAIYHQKIESLELRGFDLIELTQDSANQVLELELETNSDYPYTPATAQELPTRESILALWKFGTWIFGAFRESELVGVLAATQKQEEVNMGIQTSLRAGQHLMLRVLPRS
jgi:hypothetical protein